MYSTCSWNLNRTYTYHFLLCQYNIQIISQIITRSDYFLFFIVKYKYCNVRVCIHLYSLFFFFCDCTIYFCGCVLMWFIFSWVEYLQWVFIIVCYRSVAVLFMKGPVIYGELEAANHSKLYHKADHLGYSASVCFFLGNLQYPPTKSDPE